MMTYLLVLSFMKTLKRIQRREKLIRQKAGNQKTRMIRAHQKIKRIGQRKMRDKKESLRLNLNCFGWD